LRRSPRWAAVPSREPWPRTYNRGSCSPPREPAPALVPPPQAQPIPAEAVPPPPTATPRYQISTLAHSGGPGENAGHGAYILDVLSGEVWQIEGNRRPRGVGKMPEQ